VAGCCEYGNENSGSIKDRIFLDHLGDYQLLKRDSDTCDYLIIAPYSGTTYLHGVGPFW
jgi:hypothetical protein